MKLLQSALCGFLLTLTAAAQTATPAPSSATPSTPGAKPQLSTLGGDDVKGPEHPLTLEQMKVLYVAMGYDKLLEQNRTAMLANQKQHAPFIPEDVWDDFDATSKKVDYPAAFLAVYKKYLSTEDAAKLIEFSKTEAGKHYLESTPETARGVAMAVQKEQQQVGQEVQSRHKDEIEAAVKKYREENQPKPAPTLGPTNSATPSTTPATPPASTTPH
jgi:hypothetical protein